MLYHPEKDPIIVETEILEKEKLNEGWSTSPLFTDERILLDLKIKDYESELAKLRERMEILNQRHGALNSEKPKESEKPEKPKEPKEDKPGSLDDMKLKK